jgi:hypothetical protein
MSALGQKRELTLRCLLYPRKRTLIDNFGMSAKGQEQTVVQTFYDERKPAVRRSPKAPSDAFDFDSDLLGFSTPSNRHSHYSQKAEASSGRETS